MKIEATEPNFSIATMRLGSAILAQIISASRKSRKRWKEIFAQYKDVIPQLRNKIVASEHTVALPLVNEFMSEWAQNFDWNLCGPGYWDAIDIEIPQEFLTGLKAYGSVERVSFLLGDLAAIACATLGNNDHNLEFGLIINCPMWIELASYDEHAESFEKQMGVVIHHEMAHFRHQRKNLPQAGLHCMRSEFHAHCRGVAWALSADDLPETKWATIKLLEQQHPDVWYNEEVKLLFATEGELAFRLIRLWRYYFRKYNCARVHRTELSS